MPEIRSDDLHDASHAWRRARRSMRRLFDALADLDEAGGIATLADDELWTEAKVARAIANMKLIRRMLKDEMARLRDGPGDLGALTRW